MHIKSLKIKKLFGHFTYDLDFTKGDENLFLFHGPNGYGKTALLRIMNLIFYTDDHDLLVQIFKSVALDTVLKDCNRNDLKARSNDFRKKAFESCFLIGISRFINHVSDLGINFEGVAAIIKAGKATKEDDIINSLVLLNGGSGGFSTTLKEQIPKELTKNHPESQICQGHDICHFISKNIASKRSKNTSYDKIVKGLCMAYDSHDFKSTELCKSMTNYGKSINISTFRFQPV